MLITEAPAWHQTCACPWRQQPHLSSLPPAVTVTVTHLWPCYLLFVALFCLLHPPSLKLA